MVGVQEDNGTVLSLIARCYGGLDLAYEQCVRNVLGVLGRGGVGVLFYGSSLFPRPMFGI